MLEVFVLKQLNTYAENLEAKLEGDVAYYSGPIHQQLVKPFRNLIEQMAARSDKRGRLCLFLRTGGGSAEAVEKMVDIIRYHYPSIWFFIPDYAMSAGTIFALSGDKIFMDYSSSLGPIDPQVPILDSGVEKLVPALGILEQVEKLIQKSLNNTISPAEFTILQNQNLALLSSIEHAKELSIDLAKNWLIKYKFKDWHTHRTDPVKKGNPVTPEEKAARANEIVTKLVNHQIWHSHGRYISSKLLNDVLKLEIDDYPDDNTRRLIRQYNDLLTSNADQRGLAFYMHEKTLNAR